MKLARFYIPATCLIFILVVYVDSACPPCYRNQTLLNGDGPASATDPRRKVYIANDIPASVGFIKWRTTRHWRKSGNRLKSFLDR